MDELAYAVMAGLGLIGVEKNAHEWEAIAVGPLPLGTATVQKIACCWARNFFRAYGYCLAPHSTGGFHNKLQLAPLLVLG